MRARLVMLVVASMVAACGDDSGGGDTTTSDPATTGGPTAGPGSGTAPATMDDSTGTPPGTSDDGGSTSSSSGDDAETTAGSSSSGTAADQLSFEDDIWPVLTMVREPPLSGTNDSCSGTNGCHAGGAGGLAMPDPSTGYDNLIDAPSSSSLCGGMLEVVAGDPDSSCFVVFYENRLRDALGWVDQAETDLVRDWVASGAAP